MAPRSLTTTDKFTRWVDVAFQAAVDDAGVNEHWLDLAGRAVRLLLVGQTSELLRPFTHLLRAPTDVADLTLCAWDTATTGIPPSWTVTDWDRRRFDEEAGVSLAARGYLADVGAWTLAHALYSKDRARAWYCLPTVASLRHQRCSPFHIPLSWWAADAGLQLVHAAAVGGPGGGVMLTGAGGAGKSTTALACVANGLGYAADDYCLARIDEPTVYGVFGTGKVFPHEAWRVPALGEQVARDGDDKAELYINERYPAQMVKAMPLVATFVPKVVPGRTSTAIEKISARECLLALAPSTMFQLPHSGARALAKMTKLVQARPTFRLLLGPDTSEVAATIARFLERG